MRLLMSDGAGEAWRARDGGATGGWTWPRTPRPGRGPAPADLWPMIEEGDEAAGEWPGC